MLSNQKHIHVIKQAEKSYQVLLFKNSDMNKDPFAHFPLLPLQCRIKNHFKINLQKLISYTVMYYLFSEHFLCKVKAFSVNVHKVVNIQKSS